MKKRNLIIVILPLMLIVVLVIIKTFNKDNFSEDAIKIHELSLKQEHLLNFQEFYKMKEKASELILIDLRASEDFKKGALQSAKNIPFKEILKNQELNGIRLINADIVLYSNALYECSTAWVILSQMGFKKLYILDIPSELIDHNQYTSDTLSGKNEILRYRFTPDSLD